MLFFCFVFLDLVYYLLLVSMDCPFVIVHLVFSNLYLIHVNDFPCTLCLLCALNFKVLLKAVIISPLKLVGPRKCDVIQIKNHISDVVMACSSHRVR